MTEFNCGQTVARSEKRFSQSVRTCREIIDFQFSRVFRHWESWKNSIFPKVQKMFFITFFTVLSAFFGKSVLANVISRLRWVNFSFKIFQKNRYKTVKNSKNCFFSPKFEFLTEIWFELFFFYCCISYSTLCWAYELFEFSRSELYFSRKSTDKVKWRQTFCYLEVK